MGPKVPEASLIDLRSRQRWPSERSILRAAGKSLPCRLIAGVYFLLLRSVIVYVGQSRNVLARIGQHSQALEFDAVTVLEVPPEVLFAVESHYIHKLNPPLNKSRHRPDTHQIPPLCDLSVFPGFDK